MERKIKGIIYVLTFLILVLCSEQVFTVILCCDEWYHKLIAVGSMLYVILKIGESFCESILAFLIYHQNGYFNRTAAFKTICADLCIITVFAFALSSMQLLLVFLCIFLPGLFHGEENSSLTLHQNCIYFFDGTIHFTRVKNISRVQNFFFIDLEDGTTEVLYENAIGEEMIDFLERNYSCLFQLKPSKIFS